MPTITFKGKEYECSADKPLLDALYQDHDQFLPYSCKRGVCYACMMKATKGTPTKISQEGLRDTVKAQNYFLPCICKPTGDMEITAANHFPTFDCTLLKKTKLNEQVTALQLSRPKDFTYHPGQFINLQHPTQEMMRSYSLASLNHEDFLELHVKHIPGGQMSSWLCNTFNKGESVAFTGARGDCFYTAEDKNKPLLLAGTGTGLAPLYGIVRAALLAGHQGAIRLYHASLAAEGLYYVDALSKLAQAFPQFTYIPCVMHGDAPAHGLAGNIHELIVKMLPEDRLIKAYLCGDEPVVTAMQSALIEQGVSMRSIYADAFTF